MNFPSLSFPVIRDTANNLPEAFLDASTYMEMQPKVAEWNHDFTIPGQFEFSLQRCLAAVLRFVSTTTVGAGFAGAGVIYHTVTGLSMAGIGVVGHFKKADLDNQVKPDTAKGLQHLMLAVYNLVLCFLSPIAALAYAVAPERCEAGDRYVRNFMDHSAKTSIDSLFTPENLDPVPPNGSPQAPGNGAAQQLQPGQPPVAQAPVGGFRQHARRASTFFSKLWNNVPPVPPRAPRSPANNQQQPQQPQQ